MSTIAEIALPADEFALGDTFSDVPDARFDVVGVVAHGADYVMPQMRATAADVGTLESILVDDSTVVDAKLLTNVEQRGLFSMEWEADVHEAVKRLVAEEAVVLDAHASEHNWTFTIQFADRDSLSTVYDACRDVGVPVEMHNVQDRTTTLNANQLTTQQHETLRAAIDVGYYDIPRGATTEDLADQLDVSHQAISERLRRGHRCLVENELTSVSRGE